MNKTSTVSSQCRSNSIIFIQVNDTQVEGVDNVREAVFNHFATHFQSGNFDRPRVDNFSVKILTSALCGDLIKPFSIEEVKQALWDCDSFKSPGSNGINFSFIKDF